MAKGPSRDDLLMQPPSREIELERRIKVLEESVANLRRKLLVNEQNDLSRHKKVLTDDKTMQEEILELKKENEFLKRNIREIISELRNAARKEDVDTLKKYIELFDPMRFASPEMVERIVDEKMQQHE